MPFLIGYLGLGIAYQYLAWGYFEPLTLEVFLHITFWWVFLGITFIGWLLWLMVWLLVIIGVGLAVYGFFQGKYGDALKLKLWRMKNAWKARGETDHD